MPKVQGIMVKPLSHTKPQEKVGKTLYLWNISIILTKLYSLLVCINIVDISEIKFKWIMCLNYRWKKYMC